MTRSRSNSDDLVQLSYTSLGRVEEQVSRGARGMSSPELEQQPMRNNSEREQESKDEEKKEEEEKIED